MNGVALRHLTWCRDVKQPLFALNCKLYFRNMHWITRLQKADVYTDAVFTLF